MAAAAFVAAAAFAAPAAATRPLLGVPPVAGPHCLRPRQCCGGGAVGAVPAATPRRRRPAVVATTAPPPSPPAVVDTALTTTPSAAGLRARPLSTVAVWSLATGLAWYGWYKYCTEEELVTSTGAGPGGALSLGPFVAGVTAAGWLPAVGLGDGIEGVVTGDALAAAAALAGLGWIVGAQLRLYTAVNGVLRAAGAPPSMTWWWALVPGFNVVGGIRLIHFTAVAAVLAATAAADDSATVGGGEAAAERAAGLAALDEDVLVRRFPWVGVPKLGALQLLTTPSLWVKL